MKLFYHLGLVFLLSILHTISFSQEIDYELEMNPNTNSTNQSEVCGSAAIHQELMNSDPVYMQKMLNFRDEAKELNLNPQLRSSSIRKIPIVIHVMSTGTQLTDVSESEIRNIIRELNERYRKIPGSLGDGNGVDVELEFTLAVRDPDGNCTNAITYTDMSAYSNYMNYGVNRDNSNGISDANLKSIIGWNPTQYYNIWLVSEIDDNEGGAGVQGYAYFAGAHGGSVDGAVMLVNSFKNPNSKTLAHELGHAFNLHHTFNGDDNGESCPPNGDCLTDGDQVCDTPPHIRSPSNCDETGTNACDGGSSNTLFVHNYMDYSSGTCANEFTEGQKTRVLLAADEVRKSFKASEGNMSLIPPTTADVDFSAKKSAICIGESIQFMENSGCIPNTYLDQTDWDNITFSWNVTDGTTSLTSTEQNPYFTFNNAGVYDVTLTVTNAHGTSSLTQQGFVVVTNSATTSCSPSSSNEGNFWQTVNNVKFNTINNSTSSYINEGYTDFSCEYNTVVQSGETYPINVTARSNNYDEEVEVYIDFNDNGEFETSEIVFSGVGTSSSNVVLSGNVTIPTSAIKNKLLRMRVYGEAASITEAKRKCNSNFFVGDVEDYGVFISDDIAEVSISASPGNSISYGENVVFTASPINGGSAPTYEWYLNGNILAGETSSTYSSIDLMDEDEVYCKLISNMPGVINSPATSNTIEMTVTGPPVSGFDVNNKLLCEGGAINFSDTSLLNPTSWTWSFEGGSPATSTSSNPTVTYNSPGKYKVTLTASNGHGIGSTEERIEYIKVYSTPPNECSNFTKGDNDNNYSIGIHKFKLEEIDYTFGGPNISHDPAYEDFSCEEIIYLKQDETYNINFKGGLNSQETGVYIDYNYNADFENSELVYSYIGTGANTNDLTVPVTSTTNQLLRLRVITDFGSSSAPDACKTSLGYGQVKDFGVIIIPKECPSVSAPTVTVDNQCGESTLTASNYTGSLMWSTGETASSITVTDANTYTVTQTVNECESSAASGTSAPLTVPTAPTVTADNQCGVSTLTASNYTGDLMWSTGETTESITVNDANTYTVTQTVGGCESSSASGTSAPIAEPDAPTVSVNNQCGESILTASDYTGDLMWSTGEATESITVNDANTYTVTQTISGCESSTASGTSAPIAEPDAPTISVNNQCGESILTASNYIGDLMWSTGETSESITVTNANTYTVTQTVGGCESSAASGISAPLEIPTISEGSVINPTTCSGSDGSIEVLGSGTGTIEWTINGTNNSSNGTLPYTISNLSSGSYSITFDDGCISTPLNVSLSAPSSPDAPTVTVDNQCGVSTLTASNYTGDLMWSTGETTESITVNDANIYTVTQTVGGCESSSASGTSAPMTEPDAPTVTVLNECGESILTASNYTGDLMWSTGETTASITVTDANTYTVTQTVGDCESPSVSGTSAPLTIPNISEGDINHPTTCSGSDGSIEVLGSGTGTIEWSVDGTSTSSNETLPYTIANLATGSYTITFDDGCSSNVINVSLSAPGSPDAPTVTVENGCGESTLTASNYTGDLMWSTGETTESITVNDANTYTVTQTVGGCESLTASGASNPITVPNAPTVTVENGCGESTLTASNYTGDLLWSTGETTASITVTDANTYTITQTVDGCESPSVSEESLPLAIPSAPTVSVEDECEISILTAEGEGTIGFEWSTGETEATITVSESGTYTVTQSVDGCISEEVTAEANPLSEDITLNTTIDEQGSTLTANEEQATYQWINCEDNSVISGATSQSFTPDENGSYKVILTSTICTDVTDESECAEVDVISVDEIEIDGLSVYPNPVADKVYIESSLSKIHTVRLLDMTGKLIYQSQDVNVKHQIDLSGLAFGTYMIEVKTENSRGVYKILKTNN